MRKGKNEKGFTLIELLVVIAIIGILAGILLATVFGVQKKAQIKRCQANLSEFFKAFQIYVDDFGMPQWRRGKASWAQFVCAKILDIKQCYCPVSSFTVDTSVSSGVLGGVLFNPVAKARDTTAYPPETWTGITMFGYAGRDPTAPLVLNPASPSSTACAMCDPVQDGDRHGGKVIVGFYDGHTEVTDYVNTFASSQHGPTRIDLRVLSSHASFN